MMDSKITCISDLLDKLREQIEGYKAYVKGENEDKEAIFFYRGHAKTSYDLEPATFRNGDIEKEARLYYDAIRTQPKEFRYAPTTFEKLTIMQHYGIPTRLLDITSNPLVALYFTCKEHLSDDGHLLVFSTTTDNVHTHDSDEVSVLSNLAKIEILDLKLKINRKRLLYKIKEEKPYFKFSDIKLEDEKSNILYVKPVLNNNRIIRQDGYFLLFGLEDGNKTKLPIFEERDGPVVYQIPACAKQKIIDELEFLGINQQKLFPELEYLVDKN